MATLNSPTSGGLDGKVYFLMLLLVFLIMRPKTMTSMLVSAASMSRTGTFLKESIETRGRSARIYKHL